MTNAFGNSYVTNLLRNYYRSTGALAPDKIEQREFGFGTFESKIAFRHVAFKNETELKKYVTDTVPAFIDYSAAYYKYPDARPMERKEWLGSELRFDIDSNDIPTPCKLDHGKEWVCDKCLDAAKDEVIKLIDEFLKVDFGFAEKDYEVNFSGNRGYHVHVKKESIMQLDTAAREEISNYIFGLGLEPSAFFYTIPVGPRSAKQMGPRPSDGGWRGKVAKAFLNAAHSREDLTKLGIDKTTASWIFRNIVLVREQINRGEWDFKRIPKRDEVFANLLHNETIREGNRIDRGVTRDPTHLMRLPNSIHGGSGLIAKKLQSASSLDDFDPMKDAVAFNKGEARVRVDTRYKLLMNGQEFGPYKDQTLTLPAYAATYLYLKGAADILSGN